MTSDGSAIKYTQKVIREGEGMFLPINAKR
jgi:hypothetical protein